MQLLPLVACVTLTAIEFLDPRSLVPRYVIPLEQLSGVSVSPYEDDFGTIHVSWHDEFCAPHADLHSQSMSTWPILKYALHSKASLITFASVVTN